jgi:hypothetical protein
LPSLIKGKKATAGNGGADKKFPGHRSQQDINFVLEFNLFVCRGRKAYTGSYKNSGEILIFRIVEPN